MNPVAADEQQWIAAAASGDMAAFRALYDRYRLRVIAQVGRMIGPGADVDDVTQEVFVQVYRSLGSFAGESRFSTWLFRITWNVTSNWIRRHRRPLDLTQLRLLDTPTDTWSQLEARDMARVLHAALEEVGEDAREAFVLHELEGMTLQQIAELTGNSINTIAARVRRTRERVAQILAAATRLQAVGGGLR